MNVVEYCKIKGITRQSFAFNVGIGIRTMTKLCKGGRVSYRIAKRIEDATNGQVSAKEICNNVGAVYAYEEFGEE